MTKRQSSIPYRPSKKYSKAITSLRSMQASSMRYPYREDYIRDQYDVDRARGSDYSKRRYGATELLATPAQRLTRRLANFRGQGGYKDYLKWGSRGLGAGIGGLLGYSTGGFPGAGVGAQEGYDRGAQFSKWAGWGNYANQAPVANSLMDVSAPVSSQQQISVNSTSNEGDVIIEFTEFVQNVIVTSTGAGTSAFSNQAYSINPGINNIFPWLSQLAPNFTLYEFEGLIFQYKPTSGEYGSTNSNSLGKIIMATNYDPDAQSFGNSQQMENYDYAVACKPSCGAYHAVETAPKQRFSNQLYVRTGSTSKDKVLTDIGLFQIATEGIYTGAAGSYVIGELWVSYKVKLSRKNLNSTALGAGILYDFFSQAAGTNNTAPFGNATHAPYNSIGGSISNVSATNFKYTFPVTVSAGYFSVQVFAFDGTNFVAALVFNGITNVTNCTNSSISGQQAAPTNTLLSVANQQIGIFTLIKVTAPGTLVASFACNLSAALSANAKLYFCITQVNSTLYENTP